MQALENEALYRAILADENHWFEVRVVIGDTGILINENRDKIIFGLDTPSSDSGPVGIIVQNIKADSGFDESMIISVSTSRNLFDKEPEVGGAISGEIDLVMHKPGGDIPELSIVIPYVRACTDELQSEWIQQGVFYIDTRETTKDDDGLEILSIHGFDAMLFAEQGYGAAQALSISDNSDSSLSIEIDPEEWREGPYGEESGNYTFSYSNGWYRGSSSVVLANCGIAITGTPQNGDYFTVTYDSTSLDWPAVDTDVVRDIASLMCLPGNQALGIDSRTWDIMTDENQIPLPVGYSLREILGYIASMYAGCFIITERGELRLIALYDLPKETNYLINEAMEYIIFGIGVEEHEVSGSVVSFNDGDDRPVDDLTVSIEPVQDLNGYDYPWPPGGAGNIFDGEVEIGGISTSTGGNIDQTDRIRSVNHIPVSAEAEYYFYKGSANAGMYYFYDNEKSLLSYASKGTANAVFNTPASCAYVRFVLSGTTDLTDKIAVNYPSSITTYSPYSNICPITGWSSVNVWDDPKHGGTIWWNQTGYVVDMTGGTCSLSDDVYTVHPTSSGNRLRLMRPGPSHQQVVPGHKYFETVTIKSDGEHSVGFQNYLFPGASKTTSSDWTVLEDIQTHPLNGGTTGYIQLYSVSNTDYQIKAGTFMFFDLTAMFGAGNEPSTVAEFRALFPKSVYAYNAGESTIVSAVNGNPYVNVTVQIGSTYYGGNLNVTTGVLTVDRAMVVEPACGNVLSQTNPAVILTLSNVAAGVNNTKNAKLLSNCVQTVSANTQYATSVLAIAVNANNQVRLSVPGLTTKDQYTQWIADNDFDVLYELATPQTVQLTPTEIQTILGQNNMWADSGSISVTYTRGGEQTRILV